MADAGGASRGIGTAGKVGPLLVVALVWIVSAALFPTKEPSTAVNSSGVAGDVAASPEPGDSPVSSTAPAQAISVDTGEGPAPTAGPSTGGPTQSGTEGAAPTTAGTQDTGVTRGGIECGPGVRQIPVSSYAIQCMPAWSGDNGGATHRGVSDTEIIIVERTYPETANSRAVAAVGEQAGAATPPQIDEVQEAFTNYFNENFELYGRTVRWIKWESQFGSSTDEAQSKGREGACLDAEVIANEIGAFGVTGTNAAAVSGPFAECAAQQGLFVFGGAAYFPEKFYRDLHPYVWNTTMECERISHQVAEYMGKRLANKTARWAGEAGIRQQTRAFGTYVPNNDEYQHCTNITEQVGRDSYGIEPKSRYNYTLDVSRFPDEAARGIVQFKSDKVTTIVLSCDPISTIFLTQAATTQAYYPEWFNIGVALNDTDNLAQLFDQKQVDGHLFGMSQLGASPKIQGPGSEPGRLFKHITGKEIYDGTSGGYTVLHMMFNFLQAAGPNLTPQTIADAVSSIEPGGAPDFPFGYWSYRDGPDGTPGAGDHTAVEDSREIYWTSKFVSPITGKPGTFVETYDGRRFRNGEWPAEDPPIYPEG